MDSKVIKGYARKLKISRPTCASHLQKIKTTTRTRARGRAQPWLRMQPCKIFGQNIELLEFDPYDPGIFGQNIELLEFDPYDPG